MSYGCSESVVTERRSSRSSLPGVVPLKVPERIDATAKTGLSAAAAGNATARMTSRATVLRLQCFMNSSVVARRESRSIKGTGSRLPSLVDSYAYSGPAQGTASPFARTISASGGDVAQARDGPRYGLFEGRAQGLSFVVGPAIVRPGGAGIRLELRQRPSRRVADQHGPFRASVPYRAVEIGAEAVDLDHDRRRVAAGGVGPLTPRERLRERFPQQRPQVIGIGCPGALVADLQVPDNLAARTGDPGVLHRDRLQSLRSRSTGQSRKRES